jgi:putative molybdopterin biosynthesis protein
MSAGGGPGRRYLRRLGADEARRLLFDRVAALLPPRTPETVATPEALGRVTAAALGALHPAPFYHSAAMDGIALDAELTYAASETSPVRLAVPGAAAWVDTGDPIPPGCSAVIPSEELHWREGGSVEIHGPSAPWEHVRVTGQEIATGEMVLPAGWRIAPADLGSLLAAGLTRVAVSPRPRVLILPTGTELIRPGERLEVGKVVEFNSEVTAGMVREAGGSAVIGAPVPDDLDRLRTAVREGVAACDILVVLAGSSAGSEDFTPRAIELEGELIAHGVNIAPGKPTALGVVGGKPVIGLPGFPVAAVVASRLFLAPLVRLLLGLPEPVSPTLPALLPRALPSRLDVREFVRVRLGRVGGRTYAHALPRGSAAIFSWTKAQGLVVIPEGVEGLEAGTEVAVEIIRDPPDLERTVVLIGSHDLLIDVLEDELRARGVTLLASATGSLGGLLALRDGVAHLATSHLLDPATGTYNRTYVAKHLGQRAIRQVGLVWRQQGLMVAPGNPKRIAGWGDLARPEVSFVNRQKGSGSRVLLDFRLGEAGVAPEQVRGYRREEYTHWAVAMAVQSGLADCGLGIRSAAATMGLDFVPLEEEEFDLLIPEEHLALPGVQALLETTASERFRNRVLALGGYRFR